MQATDRNFYRCHDCLTVFAVDSVRGGRMGRGDPDRCGVCDGKADWMGRVRRGMLTRTHFECPCDERCTGARGPNCECSCGGENHGTGVLVEVVDCVAKIPATLVRHDALANAQAYRAKLAAVEALAESRKRLTGGGYEALHLGKARALKTHKARMAKLDELATRWAWVAK